MKKIDDREFKGRIDMPKAAAAYAFLCEACRSKCPFTLQELVSASGYSMRTVKKYCNGTDRWSQIVTRVDKDHFISHDMKDVTLDRFKENLRQQCDLLPPKLSWQTRLISAIARRIQF